VEKGKEAVEHEDAVLDEIRATIIDHVILLNLRQMKNKAVRNRRTLGCMLSFVPNYSIFPV